MKTLSFSHVPFTNGGRLTFAIHWPADGEDNAIEYNVSACSPQDSFTHKTGREKVLDRFVCSQKNEKVRTQHTFEHWYEVKQFVLADYLTKVRSGASTELVKPHWVHNAEIGLKPTPAKDDKEPKSILAGNLSWTSLSKGLPHGNYTESHQSQAAAV